MATGGARSRSGPAPDPSALRRERDAGSWITLPAEGRAGDPPVWPLEGFDDREDFFWNYLWATPQATQWERTNLVLEVALHARALAIAEKRTAPIAAFTLVRQQMEALGLTLPGLRVLRWKLAVPVEPSVVPAGQVASVTPIRSSRDRLTVVASGDPV